MSTSKAYDIISTILDQSKSELENKLFKKGRLCKEVIELRRRIVWSLYNAGFSGKEIVRITGWANMTIHRFWWDGIEREEIRPEIISYWKRVVKEKQADWAIKKIKEFHDQGREWKRKNPEKVRALALNGLVSANSLEGRRNHLEKHRTPEVREKHRIARTATMSKQKKISSLSDAMKIALEEVGAFGFELEYLVYPHVIDFVFPEEKVAIELDGIFWHADPREYDSEHLYDCQKRRIRADKSENSFFKNRSDWEFIRIWETDLEGRYVEYAQKIWNLVKKRRIQKAFKEGTLVVESVTKESPQIKNEKILRIFKNVGKEVLKVSTIDSDVVLTGDHLVFSLDESLKPIEVKNLVVGTKILVVKDGKVGEETVTGISMDGNREFLYDLEVEVEHKFVLENGIVVSNCPGKKYHFRPPTSEKRVKGFTERIDYVWSDEELFTFILCALDMANAAPPQTFWTIPDCGISGQYYRTMPPSWNTLLLVAASIFAARSAQAVFVVDEFSYSISGVSLDIEKSSKYAQLADAWTSMFELLLTNAKATVKLITGLSQRPYGASAIWRSGTLFRQSSLRLMGW